MLSQLYEIYIEESASALIYFTLPLYAILQETDRILTGNAERFRTKVEESQQAELDTRNEILGTTVRIRIRKRNEKSMLSYYSMVVCRYGIGGLLLLGEFETEPLRYPLAALQSGGMPSRNETPRDRKLVYTTIRA